MTHKTILEMGGLYGSIWSIDSTPIIGGRRYSFGPLLLGKRQSNQSQKRCRGIKNDRHEAQFGGAASVAYLLKGLEAQVSLVGIVGKDPSVNCSKTCWQRNELTQWESALSTTGPQQRKSAPLGEQRDDIRISYSEWTKIGVPVQISIEGQLLAAIEAELPNIEAVLVSDYAKGVCTPGLIASVIERCLARRLPVLIDPAHGGDFRISRGVFGQAQSD